MALNGTEETSDEELLRRCGQDDQVAFNRIFDRYSRQVYAAALLVLEHRSDAEDVLSDTFVLFWRRRDSITPFAGSVLPWLITTARNHARNTLRSRNRTRAVALDEDRASARAHSADVVADARDLARQLDAQLAELDPLDQRIVQLCLVEGTSYDQAAQRLNLSHGTVRNRLARARIRLRKNLSPERGEQ